MGTTVVCSCICPADSDNPKCADPNQVNMKKTYQFNVDHSGNVYLAVTTVSCSTCTAYYLVPTLANSPTAETKSQFVGSSPTGFTGLLDAPDSFFQQLGLIPCALNAEVVCVALAGNADQRSNAPDELIIKSNTSGSRRGSSFRYLLAGPAQYHRRLQSERRALGSYIHQSSVYEVLGTVDDSGVVGVQTPLLCIKAGEGVTWSITTSDGLTHYPQYTPDSLYNTNPNFDYGAFQNLQNDVNAGRPVASFSQMFSSPGVYAFHDAGDQSKQTVIGVVNQQVDCPQSFSRNSIQPLSADLLKDFPSGDTVQAVITPDYALISGIGIAIMVTLIVGVLILYVTRVTGWGRTMILSRRYRELQKGSTEDLRTMATKRHVVRTGQQTNFEEQNDMDKSNVSNSTSLIDLEGFNIQTLFDKLQDQTNLVTEQLSKQKEDVKEFYEKVERTLSNRSGPVSCADTDWYERALKREESICNEVARRKKLGSEYVKIISKEEKYLNDIGLNQINDTEKEMIRIESALLALINSISCVNQEDAAHQVLSLRNSVQTLRKRSGIFSASIAGQGAIPVDPSLFQYDQITKIKVPCKGATMQLKGDDSVLVVPKRCCIHPDTGNVVPIEGNLWYDLRSKSFVFGSNLEIESIMEDPIPFVCNTFNSVNDCYPSSSATYIHLVPECNGWPLNGGRDMIDPYVGLRVPILGVTVDYRDGTLKAVGGTMIDPETQLVKPIKIGDFYQNPESLEPWVVLGITIDPSTLKVIPIGKRCVFDRKNPFVMSVTFCN